MLPAFATLEDLAARIPGGISDEDETRAQAALDDASSAIRAYAGKSWVDDEDDLDLPTGTDAWRADILLRVCCTVARRTFDNPQGLNQESLGAYSAGMENASSDVYLTANEKREVLKAAARGGSLWSQPMSRGPLETPGVSCGSETVYLEVVPAGEPMPWAGPDYG